MTDLMALSTENLKAMTGGDSFAYMLFMGNSPTSLHPALFSVGNYPLYDLNITVIDLKLSKVAVSTAKQEQLTPEESSLFQQSMFSFPAGNLMPHGVWMGTQVHIPFNANDQDFSISFSSRNGFWRELLRIRGEAGHRLIALRVQKDRVEQRKPPIILFERVDEKFPRNDNGKVDWNN